MKIPNWISDLGRFFGEKGPQEQAVSPVTALFGAHAAGLMQDLGKVNPEFGEALRQAHDGEAVVTAFERYVTPEQKAMLAERYASGMRSDEDRIAAEFRAMVDDEMSALFKGEVGQAVVCTGMTSQSSSVSNLSCPFSKGPDSPS